MSVHPNSLANLELSNGSEPRHGETKKKRNLTVTDTAWVAAKNDIKQQFNLSVSEAVELIGRGKLKLVVVEKD